MCRRHLSQEILAHRVLPVRKSAVLDFLLAQHCRSLRFRARSLRVSLTGFYPSGIPLTAAGTCAPLTSFAEIFDFVQNVFTHSEQMTLKKFVHVISLSQNNSLDCFARQSLITNLSRTNFFFTNWLNQLVCYTI